MAEREAPSGRMPAPKEGEASAPAAPTAPTAARPAVAEQGAPGAPDRPRGWPRKVRTRILGWYALLLVAAVVTSIALERQILLTRLENRVDARLSRYAADLNGLATTTPTEHAGDEALKRAFDRFLSAHTAARGETFLTYVDGRPHWSVVTTAEQPPAEARERWARLEEPERGVIDTGEDTARYVAVPIRAGDTTGVLVALDDRAEERADAEAAVRVLGVVSLSVLAVSSLFAWLVAGRVLAPIEAVTATARRLSERDLSERIEVEGDDEVAELAQTFNTMLDRVEAAFRTRRDFLNDVSHELRTPITIVRGHLELMGDDPEERREVVALVTEELDRMARLVEDLLVLARAEQPEFLRREAVDVDDLTRSVVAKLQGLAPRDWRLDGTAEAVISADPDRLTQAVVNLAGNAVAQTEEGDRIHIGSSTDGTSVRLWVRDEGPGIDPAVQSRVFERFQRYAPMSANGRGTGTANGKAKGAGLGLGLAIVRAIAEAHGGGVGVESVPGQGAKFELTLPVTEARQ